MFFLIVHFAVSVDREDYRTCNQSRFCHRDRTVARQNWTIIPNSHNRTTIGLTALIRDNLWSQTLILNVSLLSCGAARVRISPQASEDFPRFNLGSEPTVVNQTELSSPQPFNFSISTNSFLLESDHQTLEILFSPFSIYVSDANGRRIAINADDTAVFETNRDPSTSPKLFESVTFNREKDTIKNGPTSVAIDISYLSPGVRLSGLPSHTLPFTLNQTVGRGDPIRFFNTDISHYEIGNGMAMYGSIPFIFARSPVGCDGVFWCNPSETWVDITTGAVTKSRFMSEGGYLDFFVFSGRPAAVSDIFTRLTGRPQLPPLFALAFHQSRWGYSTEEEVRKVTARLDALFVPHDVIFFDLDHTDDRRYFRWHPTNFKAPLTLLDELAFLRRRAVLVVDPHLRTDEHYDVYREALDADLLLKDRHGVEAFVGRSWPGDSVWPDFLNPAARSWWEGLFSFERFNGSRANVHIWNDMNEIAVDEIAENTAPRDLHHAGGIEEREVHNLYGHLMISATFGGLVKRDPQQNTRPFILTRSFFAGSQRYAFTWSGDNAAEWLHLQNSVPQVLSYGIASMVYTGADVGGFHDSPDAKLLSRWYQVGAWLYPFFRCHCHLASREREVYMLEGEARLVAREAIVNRYRLLPYWYTLARRANLSGIPIVRPLWWEFPEDKYLDVGDRAMLGSALFVVPFLEEKIESQSVVLPRGRWYDWATLNEIIGESVAVPYSGGRTAVFLRGGSIVPTRKRIRRSSALMFHDPFVLTIALSVDKLAQGELYVDDGESFNFSRGEFVHRRFVFNGTVLSGIPIGKVGDGEFIKKYNVVIEEIKMAGLESPPIVVLDSKLKELRCSWKDGILRIHRPQIKIKDEFKLRFKF